MQNGLAMSINKTDPSVSAQYLPIFYQELNKNVKIQTFYCLLFDNNDTDCAVCGVLQKRTLHAELGYGALSSRFHRNRLPFFHKFVWNNFTWSQTFAVFVDTHDWHCRIFLSCLSVEFLGVKHYDRLILLILRIKEKISF